MRCFFLGTCFGLPTKSHKKEKKPEDVVHSLNQRLIDVYQQNSHAVVHVRGYAKTPEKPEGIARVSTGFFISNDGEILTSASVVSGADRLYIQLNDMHYTAKLVGIDHSTNLALIKTEEVPPDLKFLSLSHSKKTPAIGSSIVAITCPLGLSPSPKTGIVSGWDGEFAMEIFPTYYMRTSIDERPGEGGSPILDLDGNVVGVLAWAIPEIASSYVLPVRAVRRIRDDLVFRKGKVERGYAGIKARVVIDKFNKSQIVLDYVEKSSPGDKAGLRPGDQLLRFGEFEIKRLSDLRNAAFYARPNQYVDVVIQRGGSHVILPMKIEALPPEKMVKMNNSVLKSTTPASSADLSPIQAPEQLDTASPEATTEPAKLQRSAEAAVSPNTSVIRSADSLAKQA